MKNNQPNTTFPDLFNEEFAEKMGILQEDDFTAKGAAEHTFVKASDLPVMRQKNQHPMRSSVNGGASSEHFSAADKVATYR